MEGTDDLTMGEVFRSMRKHKQDKHAQNKNDNTLALAKAGLQFTLANNGEALCFREEGMPKVDFFPSSGSWYVQPAKHGEKGHKYHGGAHGFIGWYTKRLKKVQANKTFIKIMEQHHG